MVGGTIKNSRGPGEAAPDAGDCIADVGEDFTRVLASIVSTLDNLAKSAFGIIWRLFEILEIYLHIVC